MRYECVYVVCALCNVHASILHTQFHNFDFISKILSFGGVMDSDPDAGFFLSMISRCSDQMHSADVMHYT